MSGSGPKLVAILLVAIVIAAGVGYWLLAPRMPSETVSYTAQPSSLSTTSEQTLATSTMSTAVTSVSETTLWINVTSAKPVSYYVSLLKSTQTQPYVQLAWELQALPDATNATAVAKITYLALNATNPEVKEAFQLMIKGGTPDPSDFTYTAPNYNTELQVLYWLACQNELKRDDTLALAVAMVNGLWVTMGDEQVRETVKKDTSDLLAFFRETNEFQRVKGYTQLEGHSLEAKLALAWTGNSSPTTYTRRYDRYSKTRMPLGDYLWDTVSVNSLRRMRQIMTDRGWFHADAGATVSNLEYYFYFEKGVAKSDHWDFTLGRDDKIFVDGKEVLNKNIQNVDWLLDYFVRNGKGIGVCTDEAAFVDAFAKSWGIATTFVDRQTIVPPEQIPPGMSTDGHAVGHEYVTYFDPLTRSWKADERQLDVDNYWSGYLSYLHILRPPVHQAGYIICWDDGKFWGGGMMHTTKDTTIAEIKRTLTMGIASSTMKQWLLYS